jgi:hypothetical protein
MSRTKIWKKALGWAVPSSDVIEVELPTVRDILDCQLQGMYPTIWFVADPDAPLESVRFHIVGTGNPMPEADLSYVGTWQHEGFVWHIFEEVT